MKKRYLIYLCLIGLLVQSFIPFLTPVRPFIQLPGEKAFGGIWESIFGYRLGFTNTAIGSILAVVIVIAIALAARARSRTADEVPTGFYNFIEMLIEGAYNYVEGIAGKNAKVFFPFFMTFVLWIVVANWLELVPGVDAIGKQEGLGHHRALIAKHEAEENGTPLTEEEYHAIEEAEKEAAKSEGGRFVGPLLVTAPEGEEAGYTIVPYVRAAATDLNFTIAVALISVIMTQYYGMKAQGLSYWSKFFTWKADEIAKNPLAVMDTGVGLLEFISEVFKIISFAFRLLGNIFAGQVLLFVIGSLLPVANLLFWHLEFGIGLLQGVVFALLTLTFMQGATEAHHGDDHH